MKTVLIILFLARFGFAYALRYLNLRHLKEHGSQVPHGFEGSIDAETLVKTARYTADQSTVALVESVFDSGVTLLFLFTPLFPLYDGWIASLSDSFLVRGVLFALILTLAQSVLEIPFSLYNTFGLERRYGFNTSGVGLWISDFLKSTAISLVILVLLLSGMLQIVKLSPQWWWFWVWLLFAGFTLLMMYLFPYVIEPLFSKVEPLKDEELEGEIRTLVERAGLRVKAVLQKDASRRTTHSNAYFTGVGRVKRIVLYDTLIEQMERNEILAILAHEVGHWKRGHLRKRLILTELIALVTLFVLYLLLRWGGVPGLFGLSQASFMGQLVLTGFLGSLAGFPVTPLSSWLSRRDEWQADRYGAALSGMPQALAAALVKLSRENLSNLHPHPLYAAFYYSHPPVVERVARLLGRAG